MSYSAKSTGVPLNELVSITSQPTSRNPVCTFSTASGRVISKCSLQPSNRKPPKSSSERFCTCRLVPIAPSKTTMRSFNVSRKLFIVRIELPLPLGEGWGRWPGRRHLYPHPRPFSQEGEGSLSQTNVRCHLPEPVYLFERFESRQGNGYRSIAW